MFQETLYPKTKQVLEKVKSLPVVADFYLAGGTALSLQLGHRKSIDLDFFTQKFPKRELLLQGLSPLSPKVIQEAEGTLDVIIDDVKVSFLEYKYPLAGSLVEYEGVKLASISDIAAMKLSAISSRGSKKDFIDLYKIMQKESIVKIFETFAKKFEGVEFQKTLILKSLLYFDIADQDPDPDYIEKIDWQKVKMSLVKDVKNYLDILNLENK